MPANPGAAAQWEANPGARAFYETAATAAAALGVRVDVFAACGGPCGLDALEPLAAGSGGALLLYPHVEQAALPHAGGRGPTPPPGPATAPSPGPLSLGFYRCSQV